MSTLICSACRTTACAAGDLLCSENHTARFIEVVGVWDGYVPVIAEGVSGEL